MPLLQQNRQQLLIYVVLGTMLDTSSLMTGSVTWESATSRSAGA